MNPVCFMRKLCYGTDMENAMNQEIQVWKTADDGVFLLDGKKIPKPAGWLFVPSGDPGLTRRLKRSGEYWCVVHRRRNRVESLGILTDGRRVEEIRRELEAERNSPAWQKKQESARKAREAKQDAYVIEFRNAVVNFLNFAPCYREIEWRLADAVTDHAVPVGSGTVARTERIPLDRRAEAAVIAWMRHCTTSYDMMTIAPVRGERREVRRRLAARSRELLAKYRAGEQLDLKHCPLAAALGL